MPLPRLWVFAARRTRSASQLCTWLPCRFTAPSHRITSAILTFPSIMHKNNWGQAGTQAQRRRTSMHTPSTRDMSARMPESSSMLALPWHMTAQSFGILCYFIWKVFTPASIKNISNSANIVWVLPAKMSNLVSWCAFKKNISAQDTKWRRVRKWLLACIASSTHSVLIKCNYLTPKYCL